MRGGRRQVTPAAIKNLHGTSRQDRPGGRSPTEGRGTLAEAPVPAWLPAEARKKWRQTLRELAPLGVFTTADADVLALYCATWCEWRRASGELTKLSPSEPAYRRVAVTVEKAGNQVRLLANELGLSPMGRTRLPEPAPSIEDNPFMRFLRGEPV